MKTDLTKPQPSLESVITDLEEYTKAFTDLSHATCSATVIENIVARLKLINKDNTKIWHRCDDPNDRPEPRRHIIMCRPAGYIGRDFEYVSGQYYPDHRPNDPWLDFGSDHLTDSGEDAIAWAYPEDLLKEAWLEASYGNSEVSK